MLNPVDTLFDFNVVLLPDNTNIPGPSTVLATGAVWTGVHLPRLCNKKLAEITLVGFFNMSDKYALEWQLAAGPTQIGPYTSPQSETQLVLSTGKKLTSAGALLQVLTQSKPVRVRAIHSSKTPFP